MVARQIVEFSRPRGSDCRVFSSSRPDRSQRSAACNSFLDEVVADRARSLSFLSNMVSDRVRSLSFLDKVVSDRVRSLSFLDESALNISSKNISSKKLGLEWITMSFFDELTLSSSFVEKTRA